MARLQQCVQKVQKEKVLNLGNCNIRSVQELDKFNELAGLTHIEELILSNSYWDYENAKKNGELHDIYYNKLTSLPSNIKYLKNLQKLYCNGWYFNWEIKDISYLETLVQLQHLDLSNNQIKDITVLDHLRLLKCLNISNNQIDELLPLNKLTDLRFLDLSNNQIKNADCLGQLKHLEYLDLSNNQLIDIRFLKNLINLKYLNLGNNNISDIYSLRELKHLECLYINNNQVRNIACLKNLVSIAPIEKLQKLNLSNNFIQDLVPIEKLIRSRDYQLNLEDGDKWINIKNNPIPVSLKNNKDREEINTYFDDLSKNRKNFLYEAKLIIVGPGGSGKTTLARKIVNTNAAITKVDEITSGIDVQTLDTKNFYEENDKFTIRIWDFSGQDIYYNIHQLFLTERALYLIVVDPSQKDIVHKIKEWIGIINLVAKNSPIILVENEITGSGDTPIKSLQKDSRYANLLYRHCVDLSNTKDGRLRALIDEIKYQIQQLKHTKNAISNSWIELYKDIKDLSKNEYKIDHKTFEGLCEENDISTKEDKNEISNLFHDLGVFLYFGNGDKLSGYFFLQPNWLVNGIYQIINNKKITEQHGTFTRKDAIGIWKETPYKDEDTIDELLQLMVKFKICYYFKSSREYILPQYLGDIPDYELDKYNIDLRIQFAYDFRPIDLIYRLMADLCKYIKSIDDNGIRKIIWKEGFVIEHRKTDAEIKLYNSKQLHIRVKGTRPANTGGIIFEAIQKINASFKYSVVETKISCDCLSCKNSESPHFYIYQKLMEKLITNRDTTESCLTQKKDIDIKRFIKAQLGLSSKKIKEEMERIKQNQPNLNRKSMSTIVECFKRNKNLIVIGGGIGSIIVVSVPIVMYASFWVFIIPILFASLYFISSKMDKKNNQNSETKSLPSGDNL